jgi:hypothetical protein
MTTYVPPQLIRSTGTLTVEDVNVSAQTGNQAFLDLISDKDSGSLARMSFFGEDDANNSTAYASVTGAVITNTDAAEDGSVVFRTMQAGADTIAATLAEGLFMAGATGGDQGIGTINATALYINGVVVTNSGGDVVGPAASTDEAVARFDLATGKLLQNSVVLIDNVGNVTGVNNLTVTGDLTVNGTTTTVNTASMLVEDPLIQLARLNSTTDAVDIGMVGLYDTSGTQDLYAGLFRDASDNKWKLFVDSQEDLSTAGTVNIAATGYAVATLVANLEGSVTGTASGNVANTLYNAQTVVVAVVDDTPVAQTVADSEFVGRPAGGNVGVMTATQARAVLGVSSGANASSISLTVYDDTVDFTAGTSTTLTLASTPASEANIMVFFDGVWQASTEWSFVATTITFGSAIPVGVARVEIRIFTNA